MRPWVILIVLIALVAGVRSLSRRDELIAGVESMVGKTTIDVGQDLKRKSQQQNLRRAARQFRASTGIEPASLNDLASDGLLQRVDQVDEWGRPLIVERTDDGLSIRSAGPDGRRGTEDDWTFVL